MQILHIPNEILISLAGRHTVIQKRVWKVVTTVTSSGKESLKELVGDRDTVRLHFCRETNTERRAGKKLFKPVKICVVIRRLSQLRIGPARFFQNSLVPAECFKAIFPMITTHAAIACPSK